LKPENNGDYFQVFDLNFVRTRSNMTIYKFPGRID